MKLRLLMRLGEADYDGRVAGYTYLTVIVTVPEESLRNQSGHIVLPEIIGGEWLSVEVKK